MSRRNRIKPLRHNALATFEALEARQLLALVADFDFSMQSRTLDTNNDNLIDSLSFDPGFVNPAGGFKVMFDGSLTTGSLNNTTFSWSIRGSDNLTRSLTGKTGEMFLPEGSTRVTLTALNPSSNEQNSVTRDITIDDILIVAMGDSYSSGEGNPIVRSSNSTLATWFDSPTNAQDAENREAHRSPHAASAKAALAIEKNDRHTSVTFVFVAQGGAKTLEMLSGPKFGNEDESVILPVQLQQVDALVGDRQIDALIMSIGGNDAGFVPRVTDLMMRGIPVVDLALGVNSFDNIKARIDADLAKLPAAYDNIAAQFDVFGLNIKNVYITEYPDPLHDQNGNFPAALVSDFVPPEQRLGATAVTSLTLGNLVAAFLFPSMGPLAFPIGQAIAATGVNVAIDAIKIDAQEAQFAYEKLLVPLNNAVRAAATKNGWTYVSGNTLDTRLHGIGSNQRWFNNFGDSRVRQGSDDGAAHPNELGHLAMAANLVDIMNPKAVITSTASNVLAGQEVTLSGLGSVATLGIITKYEWDLSYVVNPATPLSLPAFNVDARGETLTIRPDRIRLVPERVALRVTNSAGETSITSAILTVASNQPGMRLENAKLIVDCSVGNDTVLIEYGTASFPVSPGSNLTIVSEAVFVTLNGVKKTFRATSTIGGAQARSVFCDTPRISAASAVFA